MSEVVTTQTFQPKRILLLIGLWALFVLWMVLSLSGDLISGNSPSRITTWVMLDAWALGASLIVGFVGLNPLAWRNGKRLIIGSMALAMMLGRISSGFVLDYLLLAAPLLPQLFLMFFIPLALWLDGIVVIGIIASIIGAIFTFFVAVPVVLFNQILQFENAIQVYRYHERGLANRIVRAVYWLRSEPLPETEPDDSKGARFATRAEAAEIHNATKGNPARMAFGHWAETTDTPFFVATGKHVLVMASTRSGKGVALIVPHLLRYQGSAFVLDPKGENARATGRQRARLNGRVHYLDPFGITGKPQSRYNPLSRFTRDNMEAESKALAAAIFVVEQGKHDHWTDSGQQLLAALILYVYLAPDIPPESKDLPTVRKLLLGMLDHALNEMVKMDDADGLLRDLAISFKRTPEKEFGSIASTAQRQTEILDNPFMVACLSATGSAPEVDFSEWQRGTMTVYLCLAAPKFPTFNRWLRLVLTSALDTMTERLDPPKIPVCFMLDELATLGRLATVENAVGLSAGYGIQLVTVFQDIAQMKGLYGGRWASFVGNAGVRALFNLDDHETADYWSKFMGGHLVEGYSRQEDIYGLSTGRGVSANMRPLLSTDRLMMDFAADRMLVLVQGARPIVTDRVGYFDDRSLLGLWDDPRMPTRAAVATSPGSVPPVGPAGPSPTGPGNSPPNGGGPRPSTPPSPRPGPATPPPSSVSPTPVANGSSPPVGPPSKDPIAASGIHGSDWNPFEWAAAAEIRTQKSGIGANDSRGQPWRIPNSGTSRQPQGPGNPVDKDAGRR